MEEILKKYYVIHPNFAQVSVIMYSINVITALDHIHTPIISCELFKTDEIKKKVVFKASVGDGSELPRALDTALEIFKNSNRTGASKVRVVHSFGYIFWLTSNRFLSNHIIIITFALFIITKSLITNYE